VFSLQARIAGFPMAQVIGKPSMQGSFELGGRPTDMAVAFGAMHRKSGIHALT